MSQVLDHFAQKMKSSTYGSPIIIGCASGDVGIGGVSGRTMMGSVASSFVSSGND
jgi:hypothetical protein